MKIKIERTPESPDTLVFFLTEERKYDISYRIGYFTKKQTWENGKN